MPHLPPRLAPLALAVSLGGCATTHGAAPAATTPAPSSAASAPIVGLTSRDAIEAALPAWRDAIGAAAPDAEASRALADVPPGAEVDVFLGTWCGDSRREVARLFRALEHAPSAPFTLRFVGVGRDKVVPGLTDGVDLRFVPTVVVRRGGVEVGRIVESAPDGIERDLGALLRGTRTGVITGRTDL